MLESAACAAMAGTVTNAHTRLLQALPLLRESARIIRMKPSRFATPIFAASFAVALCACGPAAAQSISTRTISTAAISTGTLEFEARVTPAESQPEPVRQLSFYLLRKSLADIVRA